MKLEYFLGTIGLGFWAVSLYYVFVVANLQLGMGFFFLAWCFEKMSEVVRRDTDRR